MSEILPYRSISLQCTCLLYRMDKIGSQTQKIIMIFACSKKNLWGGWLGKIMSIIWWLVRREQAIYQTKRPTGSLLSPSGCSVLSSSAPAGKCFISFSLFVIWERESSFSTHHHRCCRPPGWFLSADEPGCDWQPSGRSAGSPTEPRWRRWRWGRSGGGLSGNWPFCICTETSKQHHTICNTRTFPRSPVKPHSGLCTLHLSSIIALKDQAASVGLLTSCSMRLKGKPRATSCSANQIGLFIVCLLQIGGLFFFHCRLV